MFGAYTQICKRARIYLGTHQQGRVVCEIAMEHNDFRFLNRPFEGQWEGEMPAGGQFFVQYGAAENIDGNGSGELSGQIEIGHRLPGRNAWILPCGNESVLLLQGTGSRRRMRFHVKATRDLETMVHWLARLRGKKALPPVAELLGELSRRGIGLREACFYLVGAA